MLSKDIKIVDKEFIEEGFSSNGVWVAWSRIKTALAELGITPNTASPPCKCVVKQIEVPGMGIIYSQRECPIHGHLHGVHLSNVVCNYQPTIL